MFGGPPLSCILGRVILEKRARRAIQAAYCTSAFKIDVWTKKCMGKMLGKNVRAKNVRAMYGQENSAVWENVWAQNVWGSNVWAMYGKCMGSQSGPRISIAVRILQWRRENCHVPRVTQAQGCQPGCEHTVAGWALCQEVLRLAPGLKPKDGAQWEQAVFKIRAPIG